MQSSWHDLATAADGLSDAIGTRLFPVLHPVTTSITNFVSNNRDLAGSLAAASGGLAGIAFLTSGPVLAGIKGLAGPWLALGSAAVRGVDLAVGAVGEFVTGLQLGFSAFESFSLVLAANPIGLTIVAIAALAGAAFALWKYWAPISGLFKGLWHGIVDVATWAWEKLKPILDAIGRGASALARALGFSYSAPAAGADEAADGGAATGGGAGVPSKLPAGRANALAQPLAIGRGGDGAPGAAGKVQVEINMKGAPPGTAVRAATEGLPAPKVDVGYGIFGMAPAL